MEACGSAHHWARGSRVWASKSRCCPRATCAPTCGATRPTPPMPRPCSKPRAVPTCAPCASRASSASPAGAAPHTQPVGAGDRTRRINTLRGYCREFGIAIARARGSAWSRSRACWPSRARASPICCVRLVCCSSKRCACSKRASAHSSASWPRSHATARRAPAAVRAGHRSAHQHGHGGGHLGRCDALQGCAPTPPARSGLTPKEHSSGQHRQLGRISKQGDRYLRMLLTHGARSVLRAAAAARNAGKPVQGLRAWALAVQDRSTHNKACCALANKLARALPTRACATTPPTDRTPLWTRRSNARPFAMPAGALAN